ncbi:MAG: hypothetical protein QXD59_00325 [Candidatus Caldarchaeum sp.]
MRGFSPRPPSAQSFTPSQELLATTHRRDSCVGRLGVHPVAVVVLSDGVLDEDWPLRRLNAEAVGAVVRTV